MLTAATPRIRIDDLPELESLTEGEAADVLGAGRRAFRPTVETLEDRQLLSASAFSNLGGVPVQFNLRDAGRGAPRGGHDPGGRRDGGLRRFLGAVV
jgi:hypothetical protein